MFCQKCGKQIPDNTKFCSYCGAQQSVNPASNQQPYTAPQSSPNPPQKKKSGVGILVALAVVAVAFMLGKSVFAPSMLTDGDTSGENPDRPSISFPTPPPVGINEEVLNGSDQASVQSKTFEINYDGVLNSTVTFDYQDDTVTRMQGDYYVYDLSVDISSLKQDAETAQELIAEYGMQDASVEDSESADGYSMSFYFNNLDQAGNDMVAELAAQFIGFSAENGKISMTTAENAMIQFGYSLQ